MKDHHRMRAWAFGAKEYIYMLEDGLFYSANDKEDGGSLDLFIQAGWPIELCTGVKDKNGNLIYEGDIVRFGNGEFEKGQVAWYDGCFGFLCSYCHNPGLFNFRENQLEIIGNIHQNLELLEEIWLLR